MKNPKNFDGRQADAERLLSSIGTLLDSLLLQEPDDAGRPLRYNPLDYAILRRVEAMDGCSGSDLARELKAARTSIQSALDRLERQDLIEKRPSKNGGRIRTLHLTQTGKDIRARIHAHDLINMKALLAPLSAEERTQILPLLERVAGSLKDGSGDQAA